MNGTLPCSCGAVSGLVWFRTRPGDREATTSKLADGQGRVVDCPKSCPRDDEDAQAQSLDQVSSRPVVSIRNQQAARAFDDQEVSAVGQRCRGGGDRVERQTGALGLGRLGRRGGQARTDTSRRHGDRRTSLLLPTASRASCASGAHPVSAGLKGTGRRPRRRAYRARPAATVVFPTPVSVPVTNSPRRPVTHGASSARASVRRSRSSRAWPAERVMRRRAVPAGTVGGRIAGTKMDRRRSSAETSSARSLAPSRNGKMGPTDGGTSGTSAGGAPRGGRQARGRGRRGGCGAGRLRGRRRSPVRGQRLRRPGRAGRS